MSDQDSTQMLNEYLKPLIIIGILNYVIGFFTWINGPLIIFVKVAFSLNDLNAFLVLMVFYISYLVFSLPSLWVLKRTGTRKGLSLSLIVMAIGAAIFGQCIYSHWYPGTLSGLFVIGIGLCGLQTVVNPYVSILGPIEKGAQRQAIMGICNKVAGICAPIIFGLIVTNISGIQKSIEVATSQAVKDAIILGFAQKIYYPYMAMALILLVLSAGIYYSKLPEMKHDEPIKSKKHQEKKTKEGLGLPTSPRLWFGVLCIFMYVGVEVLAGSIIGTYGEGFNLSVDITKFFTSFTLIAMLFGYIVGIIVTPKWLSQETYLAISAVLGIILAIFAWCTTGYYSVAFVALLGFANSMMWPAFFPIAIRGLGKQTTSGSALMVMGICGGAVIPEAFSYFKEIFNFQSVFSGITILGYLCIGCYGIYGYFSLKKDQRAQATYETF